MIIELNLTNPNPKSRRDDINNTIPSGFIALTRLHPYNHNTPLVLKIGMKNLEN